MIHLPCSVHGACARGEIVTWKPREEAVKLQKYLQLTRGRCTLQQRKLNHRRVCASQNTFQGKPAETRFYLTNRLNWSQILIQILLSRPLSAHSSLHHGSLKLPQGFRSASAPFTSPPGVQRVVMFAARVLQLQNEPTSSTLHHHA